MPEEKNPARRLPFGQSKSYCFSDAYHFTDAVASSSKTLQSYDAIETTEKFNCAVSSIKIGNLDLVASCASPSRFAVRESQGLYLCFLYDGSADASVDGFHGFAIANEFAFLSPEVQRTGETTSLSMVQLSLHQNDVLAVSEHMFGMESFPAFKRFLQRPRNIGLSGKNASVSAFLKGIIKQIDDCNLDAALLKALGVDDVIYRTIATMVAYDQGLLFEEKAPVSKLTTNIRNVAEFIDAHLAEDITLTDLEKVAGVGSRALQYGFFKAHGCSPTQWMRSRRLEQARLRLLKADGDARIVDIALSVGWRNISSFPSAYAERYGELPSDTVKHKKK
jgi:AraC-like DNA-binding protein